MESNNQTYIHYTLVHSSIITYMGDSLSGDPLVIIIPFCVTRAYANVNQHMSHLNHGWNVHLSVLFLF